MNKDIDRIDNLESDDNIKIIEAKTVNLPNRFINQPSGSESDKNKIIIEKETIEQLDVIAVPLGSDKSKKQKVQKSAQDDVNDATEEESPEEQESKEEAEDKGSEKQPSENKETSDSEDSAPKSKENDSSEDETSEDADEDSSADTKEASAPEEGDDSKEDQPSEQEPSSEEKPDQKEQPAPKPEDENADEQPKDNADNSPSGNKVDDAKKAAKQDADTKARSGANKPGDKADDFASPTRNKDSSDLGDNISKAIEDNADKIKNSEDVIDAVKEIVVDEVKKEVKRKVKKLMKNPYAWLAIFILFVVILLLLLIIGLIGGQGNSPRVFNQIHNYENLEFHMRDASDQTFELVSMKKLLMGAAYAKYYDQLKDETNINENLIEQIDNYMVYTRTRALKLLKYEGSPENSFIEYGFNKNYWFQYPTVLYSELNRGVPYCNPDKGCVKDEGYTEEELKNIEVHSYENVDGISKEDPNYKGTIFYTNENNQLKENAIIIPPATDVISSLLEDSYNKTKHLLVVFTYNSGYSPYNSEEGDEEIVFNYKNGAIPFLPDYNNTKGSDGYSFEHYIKIEIGKKQMIQNNEEIPNLPEVYKTAQIYKTKPLVTPLTMALTYFDEIIDYIKTPNNEHKNVYWDFPYTLYNISEHAFKEPNIGPLYAWPIGSLEKEEVPESEIVKTFNCDSCKENNNCDSCDEKGVVIRVKDTKVVNEDGTVDVCAINFGRVVSDIYCDISGCKPAVVIFHDNGHVSIYENVKAVERILDTEVSLAQKIGTIEVGEELRIQIRENGEHLNPLDYIDISKPRPSSTIDELIYEEGETEKQTVCLSLLKTGYSYYAVAGVLANFNDETVFNYMNQIPEFQECLDKSNLAEKNEINETLAESNIECRLEKLLGLLNRDKYYLAQINLLYSTSPNHIAKKFCQNFYGGDNKEYICENITVDEADLEYVGNRCSTSE
ncbi:MAG: hypothetical protein GX951_05885 [Mollicutes bacterium]|nr:hypothetical protein [Mollicutes bacterium]